ncbi:protein dissatisfaction-like [Argiope bruennichi]|uniref:Uncharacterized protein n=1 Tax=Argiope bruennichi TaxID=94029 RepID=A0A8T0EUI8_ARGBR|nr:protein dissatisfaction-like [Argiope bruennichi]KAF8781986.1 hypothetical protein HNY73_012324 [Argiope bruennichi]
MAAHGWIVFLAILGIAWAGRHHNQQSSIEKLLAAGLIAKALAKGGEEGGGDGGHHYMPVHVPIHHHGHVHGRDAGSSAAASHHHHVHHKYVPIPVKHHTNFIIAHHKVPVPIVKTKVVHVPVQQTRIVPIIVHKDQPPHRPDYHTLASEDRKVRVTSLGTLRSNGTAPLQFHRPTGSPDKWIVVVKSKRRRPHGRKS